MFKAIERQNMISLNFDFPCIFTNNFMVNLSILCICHLFILNGILQMKVNFIEIKAFLLRPKYSDTELL